MGLPAIEYLGWAATAVFVSSYFCARAETMKRVQMAGAVMWIAYGLAIGASPVVAANLLVLAAAAWTSVNREASPLGLPHARARAPLRRLAPIAWLAWLRPLARRRATASLDATPRSLRSDQAPT